jgi:hypothetical protein
MKSAFLALSSMWICQSMAEIPSWAKEGTLKKNGNIVTAICNGSGPTVNIARQDAISNCQATVSQFLNGELKINSLAIETEKSVGFHQEVEQQLNLKDFTCNPKKDEVIESNGSFQFWIKCEFDLSKVSIVKAEAPSGSSIKEESVDLKSMTPVTVKNLSEGKVLFLETIPQCESVLVKGVKPRTIDCNKNPMKIVLDEDDQTVIVRALNYQPKTIPLKGRSNREILSVILEKN